MITTKHKKAVILSALMFSLTGASAYVAGSGHRRQPEWNVPELND